MATIRAYTDLDQSKKLAKILPLESADMHYCLEQRDIASGYEIGITPFIKASEYKGKCNIIDVQPAWSLAALLSVLEKPRCFQGDKPTYWFCGCFKNKLYHEVEADNPVDACYEMIIKLHEQTLL